MRPKTIISIFLTLSILGCGIEKAPKEQAQKVVTAPVPEELKLVSGDSQSAVANSNLNNLIVLATGTSGEPLSGADVTFKVESGVVILGGTSAKTDANGKASVSVQLATTVGGSKISATLMPDPIKDPKRTVYFNVTSVPGAPTQLVFTASTLSTFICSEDIWTVKFADQYGNGISGVLLTVQSTNFNLNAVNAPLALTTDAQGVINFKTNAPSSLGSGTVSITGPSSFSLATNVAVTRGLRFLPQNGPSVIQRVGETPMGAHVKLVDGCQAYPGHAIRVNPYGTASNLSPELQPPFVSATTGNAANVNTNAEYIALLDGLTIPSSYLYYYQDFFAQDGTDTAFFRFTINITP